MDVKVDDSRYPEPLNFSEEIRKDITDCIGSLPAIKAMKNVFITNDKSAVIDFVKNPGL